MPTRKSPQSSSSPSLAWGWVRGLWFLDRASGPGLIGARPSRGHDLQYPWLFGAYVISSGIWDSGKAREQSQWFGNEEGGRV